MLLLVSRLNDLKECEEIRRKFFEIVFWFKQAICDEDD